MINRLRRAFASQTKPRGEGGSCKQPSSQMLNKLLVAILLGCCGSVTGLRPATRLWMKSSGNQQMVKQLVGQAEHAEKSKWWTLTSAQEEAARLRFATPWRRAPSRKRMRVTTVALPEQVHRRLTAAATEERTVMTELVRQAVLEWLERRDSESVEKDEPK